MSDDFMNSLIEQRKKREENKASDSLSGLSDLDILFGSKTPNKTEDNKISQTNTPEIKKVTPAIGLDLKQNNLQQGQMGSLSVQQMRAMPAQPQDRQRTLSTMQAGQMTSPSVQQPRTIPIQPQERQRMMQAQQGQMVPPNMQQMRATTPTPQDRQRMLQQMQAQQGQISPAQPRATQPLPTQDRHRMLQQMQNQQMSSMLQPGQQRVRQAPANTQLQDRQRMLQQMQAQQGQISPAQQNVAQVQKAAQPTSMLNQQRPMAATSGIKAPIAPPVATKPEEISVNLEKKQDISQIMAQEIKQTAEHSVKVNEPAEPPKTLDQTLATEEPIKLFDSAPSTSNAGNSRSIIESARRASMQKRAMESNSGASGRIRMSPASAGLLAEMRGMNQPQKPAQPQAPAIQNIKVDDPSISDEVDRLLKQIGEFHEISDRLNEEIDTLKRQQTQMTQFITVFFNQDTVENALDTIFSSIKNFMKCDALEFMYLDEPQGLIFLYSLTNDGIFQWEDYVSYKGTDFEPVIAAQQPDIVNDLSLKEAYPVSGIAESFGLRSLLRVPCASAESFVGYLDIFAKDPSAYSEEEQQKASTYAIAAAFFFENMFLKEKLSYIRKSSRPKPDRDYLNMTEYLKQQFDKPLDEINENADNTLKPKNGKLMSKQYEFLQNIKGEVTFIKKCSLYLREYLEFTADQKQPNITRVDIKKLVKDVDKRMKKDVEDKSVRMMIEHEKNPPQILADYNWMLRILLALLDNALEATEINKSFRLSVDTTSDPEYAEFGIYDNGKDQIMSGDYTNIFTPFGTLSTKANKKRTRLFLNLPLVKMYVERMNGIITVESQKEDTMFSVKIPIAKRR